MEEVKQQHPGLDVNTEDIIEKSWTKRQKAASQLLKKFDAVSACNYDFQLGDDCISSDIGSKI